MRYYYLDQPLDRAKRYLNRIESIDQTGFSEEWKEEELSDDFYSFFVWCYHIKDWLIQRDDVDTTEIEKFINVNESLSICADMANGTKHYNLKRKRTEIQPSLFSLDICQHKPERNEHTYKFYIKTKSKSVLALDVAKECLNNWEYFIQNNTRI
ncbi:hypothetical protein H1X88_22500 [Vibrio parahaemolyticus]|uniref:hypothetical protein n=1 Tax=Vibrio parahaemolyticus TaxID=670 RepID=UPI0016557FAD|nr:hypothetical protein [Vibrio parahaemolyticus]MBC8659524.1 hypothetical protein [Vibrio parahaemolyticus]